LSDVRRLDGGYRISNTEGLEEARGAPTGVGTYRPRFHLKRRTAPRHDVSLV